MKTCIFLLSQYVLLICGQELLVTLEQGTVRGHKHATRGLYEFHGIPYATAPTGNNKFKAPLPAPRWGGILNAANDTILCPQMLAELLGVEYTEDCLVANVFVPENNGTLKPVLVIIHGGSFILGFGNIRLPYNLVERDIVVVTMNYRLGALGFLCLNTETVPGNVGLRDQIAALKWVKSNIAAFGGNPEDITVSGYSAGAASAELLMLSPAAKNLFNKVILESSSALSTWAVNPNGLQIAQSLALNANISDVNNITALENYFLHLSYPELVGIGSIPLFFPCLENNDGVDEPVIGTLPHKILQSGNYTKLPLLTGYTNAEGLLYYPNRKQLMAGMNKDFVTALPPFFNTYSTTSEANAAKLLKAFYFDGKTINENSVRSFTDYFTDSLFAYWIIDSAKYHAVNSTSVYLYEYRYVNSKQQANGTGLGAGHCDQTYLILEDFGHSENYTQNDLSVQIRLVNMWTNFIKFGSPMFPGPANNWEPLDVKRMNYFVIDFNMENETFPLAERMQLWEHIVKGNGNNKSADMLLIHFALLLSFMLLVR